MADVTGGAYWGLPSGPTQAPRTAADVATSLIPDYNIGYRTAAMDWADLMRNVGGTWAQRVPLSDLRGQLESRWQLGGPIGGFAEFLGGYAHPYGGPDAVKRAQEDAALRAQAYKAQRVGAMSEDQAITYAMEQGALESDPYLRAISLHDFFDPLEEGGEQRQFNVANLLALQRPSSGGVYQGRMARNIQNAMSALYSQRFGQGYGAGTFLDWYLSQSETPQEKQAREAAAAEAAAVAAAASG